MTKIHKIALAFSLVASSSLIMSTARAAAPPEPTWVYVANPATLGFTAGSSAVTFTYGPTAAKSVFVYDGANPGDNQSPATIKTLVSTLFGLPSTGAGSLSTISSVGDLRSATSESFSIATSFDYLAVHYGRGELIFHWAQPIAAGSDFTIGGLPRGLSNYRAFSSTAALTPPVSPVPEPETYGMMLAGLGMMAFLVRRRKSA